MKLGVSSFLLAIASVLGGVHSASASSSSLDQTLQPKIAGMDMPFRAPPAPDDCVSQAAAHHSVNSWVLRAIIKVESNFNAKAINRNKNGTVDVGIAQMNSMHFKELKKHDITQETLLDACNASYVAAWHLAKQLKVHGNTWYGIASYHSATPCFNKRYKSLLWNVLLSWKAVEGSREQVPSMASCDSSYASTSKKPRSGAPSSQILAMDVD